MCERSMTTLRAVHMRVCFRVFRGDAVARVQPDERAGQRAHVEPPPHALRVLSEGQRRLLYRSVPHPRYSLLLHYFTLAVAEFYEELLSLVGSLTSEAVSAPMWTVLPMVYDMFRNDGFDYFTGVCFLAPPPVVEMVLS